MVSVSEAIEWTDATSTPAPSAAVLARVSPTDAGLGGVGVGRLLRVDHLELRLRDVDAELGAQEIGLRRVVGALEAEAAQFERSGHPSGVGRRVDRDGWEIRRRRAAMRRRRSASVGTRSAPPSARLDRRRAARSLSRGPRRRRNRRRQASPRPRPCRSRRGSDSRRSSAPGAARRRTSRARPRPGEAAATTRRAGRSLRIRMETPWRRERGGPKLAAFAACAKRGD